MVTFGFVVCFVWWVVFIAVVLLTCFVFYPVPECVLLRILWLLLIIVVYTASVGF